MKALVIGAGGMFGGRMARALLARGHAVRALQRPGGTPVSLPGAEVVVADALDGDAVYAAAAGCDAIVFGFHLPYGRWHLGAETAARVAAEASARCGATVLFPGNVYGLGPDFEAPIREDAPRRAPSEMGALRNRMEAQLRQACERGGRAIVLRAGDFIGPGTDNSWLSMMTARAGRGGALLLPAPDGVPHTWAFLPDVIRAGVALLEKRDALSPYEEVNFEGYVLPQEVMVERLREALGDPGRRTRRIPWALVRVLSLLSPMLRAVLQVRYLWRVPLRLDGGKLRRLLPDFTPTPLPEALASTLGERAAVG